MLKEVNNNSSEVVECLKRELQLLGSHFSENLVFNHEENELAINLASRKVQEKLVLKVSLKSMPLLSDYDISSNKSCQIEAKLRQDAINPDAAPIMALMCDLYNATNKLEQWDRTYPLLTLKDHTQLIDTLFSFRSQGQKVSSLKNLLDKKQFDDLLLESFLGSREFTYKQDALASAGIETPNNAEKGLLAIIDFLNHKMGESNYVINRQTGCMEIYANEVDESGELYVQYGFMDALQAFLTYGFVDTKSPILYSGKMQFKLKSGLNFVVLGMSGGLTRTVALPKELQHLHNYLPPGIKRDGNNVVVNELVIPSGDNLMNLRQALVTILRQCDAEGIYADESNLRAEMFHIEQQVLQLNIQYWKQFGSQVEATVKADNEFNETTERDLNTLVNVSVEHCLSYAKAMGYEVS